MNKIYAIYCVILLGTFAWANAHGYVYSSFFSGQGTANKGAQHYHK
jgi:hypothetical protein